VSERSISVDDAALFASWPPPRRAELLKVLPPEDAAALPFIHRDLIRVEGDRFATRDAPEAGNYDLRALHDVLDFARKIEKTYKETDPTPAPPETDTYEQPIAAIHAAAEVPYGVLVSVIFTAAQAEYHPLLIAHGPQGDVKLGLDLPRAGERGSAVRVVIDKRGAFVTAEAGLARIAGRRDKAPTSSLGRAVLGPDRACPIAADPAPIGEVLRAIAKRMPESSAAILVPAPELRWKAVAAIADAAASAGFPRFMLGIQREDDVPDCAHAIPADAIRTEDFPSRR
jgi:hypothetical protein